MAASEIVANIRPESSQSGVVRGLAGVNSPPFPSDRDLGNPSHRWEFEMKVMGYNVTADQMPDPGASYRTSEMYNRLNPGRPLGPVVVNFRF